MNEVTRRGRTTQVLVRVLFFAVVAGSVVEAAEPRKGAETMAMPMSLIWEGTDPMVLPTLDHLLGAWDEASGAERTEMARVFAVLGFRGAVPFLTRCAGGSGPEAVSCMLALVAMGSTDAAPVLREQLRTSEEPEVIVVAALILAAWRDHFSHSLMVQTLLDGRGGELAGVGLVLAIDRLGNRLGEDYLRFVRLVTRYPLVRLNATARLGGRLSGWRAGAINRELRQTLAADLDGEAWTEDVRHRARLMVWGLSRAGEGGCIVLLRRLKETRSRGDAPAARVFDLLGSIDGACIYRARRLAPEIHGAANAAGLGDRERSAPFPIPTVSSRFDTRDLLDSLNGLSNRFALCDGEPSMAEFAQITEDLAQQVLPVGQRWGVFSIVGAPVKSRVRRTLWRDLEEGWGGANLPRDFDRFDPAFRQPDWFPETLEITIDDGPRPARLEQVLDVLNRHGVRATFFFIGSNIMVEWLRDSDRLRGLLHRLVLEGHAVGYHSMDHDTTYLRHIQAWRPPQVVDDVRLFLAVLELAMGHPYPLVWARSPGGMGVRQPWLREAFADAGLRASVPWTVDSETWPPGISSRRVRTLARTVMKKGGRPIILLHETAGLARELDAFLGEIQEIWQEEQADSQ